MARDVATEVKDLRETIEILTAGLMKMLGIQAQHSAMLKEILGACTEEPDEDSPLVKTIKQLVTKIDALPAAVTRALLDGELSGRG